MQKEIVLQGQVVSYRYRVHPNAKRVGLTISKEGNLSVTAPKLVPQYVVKAFLESHAEWILGRVTYFKERALTHPPVVHSPSEKKDTVAKAKELVQQKLKQYNEMYKLRWNKVTIKDTKTRWGSCSKRGNLNFNYKIAMLPEHLVDYVVVHELCHLGEFNHSQDFWNLVAKAIPEYKECREELKKVSL